jgi:hypothetical protein
LTRELNISPITYISPTYKFRTVWVWSLTFQHQNIRKFIKQLTSVLLEFHKEKQFIGNKENVTRNCHKTRLHNVKENQIATTMLKMIKSQDLQRQMMTISLWNFGWNPLRCVGKVYTHLPIYGPTWTQLDDMFSSKILKIVLWRNKKKFKFKIVLLIKKYKR